MLSFLFGQKRESLNLKTLNNKQDGRNEQAKIVWEDQGNKFEEIDQCLRRNSLSPKDSKTLRRMDTPSSPPSFGASDPTVDAETLEDRLSPSSSPTKP
jgi:Ulp1 family protease